MADEQKLVGVPCETFCSALRSLVLHLNGEKAALAVGGLVTLLKLLERADVPEELLPECISACKFVREGVQLMASEYHGLVAAVESALRELERKLAEQSA